MPVEHVELVGRHPVDQPADEFGRLEMPRAALRCKPADKFMLVTDAMPSIGSATKEFVLQGKRISARGGVCVDSRGTLAGSDLDMAGAVRNAIDRLGVKPEAAFRMASGAPAAFLRLQDRGAIAPGSRADFALLDENMVVRSTWIGGQHEPAPAPR